MLDNIVPSFAQLQGDQAWGEGGGGDKYNGTLSGEIFLMEYKEHIFNLKDILGDTTNSHTYKFHFDSIFGSFNNYLNIQVKIMQDMLDFSCYFVMW